MTNLEYALQNFLEATSRQEFKEYAQDNPYAEVEVEHHIEVSNLVQELWQRRFSSKCPEALVIAGLYHDIDRVFPAKHSNDSTIRTTRRAIDTKNIPDSQYLDSQEKKRVHPENCANIFQDYNPRLDTRLQEDITYLIEHHEVGGDKNGSNKLDLLLDSLSREYNLNVAANILCEADAIVFFTLIIYSYAKDRPIERIQQKIRFSYDKLSLTRKEITRKLKYKDIEREDGIILNLSSLVQRTLIRHEYFNILS